MLDDRGFVFHRPTRYTETLLFALCPSLEHDKVSEASAMAEGKVHGHETSMSKHFFIGIFFLLPILRLQRRHRRWKVLIFALARLTTFTFRHCIAEYCIDLHTNGSLCTND